MEIVDARRSWLSEGSEMARRISTFDWASTPLGPIGSWPQSLRVAVRLLLSTRHPMFIWWGPDLIQFYNDAYAESLGPEKHPSALAAPGRQTWPEIWHVIGPQIAQIMAGGEATWHEDQLVPMVRHGGPQDVWWTYSFSPIDEEEAASGVGGVLVICRETTAEVLAERASDERYHTLFNSIESGFCIVELKNGTEGEPFDYRVVEANPAFEKHTGLHGAEGKWLREFAPDLEEHWYETYGRVALTGRPERFEAGSEALGRWFDVYAFRTGTKESRRVAILFNDISERRNAEIQLRKLADTLEQRVAERTAELTQAHEALRQSQKMEAVGQLTGGLAHDFNNLLAGISGSLDMMQTRVQQGRIGDLDRYMVGAQGAAKRAAALTHRLLAFSRRQTLEPKPTDVNRLVAGMEDLIRRTVGPQITVETVAKAGLWSALVDPNQLENALLNLCINARDAMPDGGQITIETGNQWLDDRAARERDLPPGQYLSMCVSDNGSGMSADVIERAFDPFFTTKPIGVGTGLGLSMIYGFARQSGGQVRIYSEVGSGTMVCIYLPRHHEEEVVEAEVAPALPRIDARGKTVLVVDDEPLVRMLVVDAVEDLGFRAIEAGDGPQALQVLRSDAAIDLLVTDVGLPNGMNGRQVADAARELRTDLKVLFVTGYAENAVLNHGHLDPGMQVVTKPFDMTVLANRIQGMVEN
ncbi:ATP-binding protein [Aureimonas sp. AU22]|uniref:ATP-binding protein n=1 Tax=Aureimonas sp. AU22 TaxID=1638162 RepID=UPI001FCD5857|nr:ATP-binding protein [Aureimonas sp. AU22]